MYAPTISGPTPPTPPTPPDPYTSNVMSYADKVKQLLANRSAPTAAPPVTGALPGTPPENPSQDNMTINARSGEYVFPEPAVKYYGVKKLETMVQKAIEDINPPGQPAAPAPPAAQTYARGGLVNRKHFLKVPKGNLMDRGMKKAPAKMANAMMPTGMPPAPMDPSAMDPSQMGPPQMDPSQMGPPTQPTQPPLPGYARGGSVDRSIEPGILPGNRVDNRVDWASRLGMYDELGPREGSWLWNMMGGPMGAQSNPWGGIGGPLGSGWSGWGQPSPGAPDYPQGGGAHAHTPPRSDAYTGGYIGHGGVVAPVQGYARGGLTGFRGGISGIDNPFSVANAFGARAGNWYGGESRLNPYVGLAQPGVGPGYNPPPGYPGSGQGPTYNPSYFDPQGYPWAQPVGPDTNILGGGHAISTYRHNE